jgi:hypothetical protein
MAGYGTDELFTTWLSDNGYTLPENAPAKAILRQRGSQYIDSLYGARFVGEPVAPFGQDRAWPRRNAVVGGVAIPETTTPNAVVYASFYAAFQEATNPGSLTAVGSSTTTVKREKVGELEVEYQNSSSSGSLVDGLTPIMTVVDGMLAPYLRIVPAQSIGMWSIG